jgi:small subunit ribosomal protein S19e
MNVFDVPANELIPKVASELQKNPSIKPPSWAGKVKSGSHLERVPEKRDFWYVRCASLLRTIFLSGEVGVRRLRHKYGGRKEHRVSRAHHTPAGGKTIRLAMQQLEKAGLMKKGKFGRVISSQGAALLERCSAEAAKQ